PARWVGGWRAARTRPRRPRAAAWRPGPDRRWRRSRARTLRAARPSATSRRPAAPPRRTRGDRRAGAGGRRSASRRGRRAARRSQPRPDALDGLFGLLARAERGQAEVALAAGAEARARHTDHVRPRQQRVEEVPRGAPGRRAQPDVGRVAAAVHRIAAGTQALGDEPRVLHVVFDERAHLLGALGAEDGGAGLLDQVRRALVLAGRAAVPERVEARLAAVGEAAACRL